MWSGRPVQRAGKGGVLALIHPHVLLEAQAFAIRKEQRLGEQQRSARQDRRVVRAGHLLLDELHHLGIFDQALAHRLEDVVHHHGRGLALGDGFARGVQFVLGAGGR